MDNCVALNRIGPAWAQDRCGSPPNPTPLAYSPLPPSRPCPTHHPLPDATGQTVARDLP